YQIAGGIASQGFVITLQKAFRPGEHPFLRGPPHSLEQAQNLLMALSHPLPWTARPPVEKWGRVDRLHGHSLWREKRVNHRELVIDFVVGVRIEHHSHLSLRRREAF